MAERQQERHGRDEKDRRHSGERHVTVRGRLSCLSSGVSEDVCIQTLNTSLIICVAFTAQTTESVVQIPDLQQQQQQTGRLFRVNFFKLKFGLKFCIYLTFFLKAEIL